MAQMISGGPRVAPISIHDVQRGVPASKSTQSPRLPLATISNASNGHCAAARSDAPPRLRPGFVAERRGLWEERAAQATVLRPYIRLTQAPTAATQHVGKARSSAPLANKAAQHTQTRTHSLRVHDERHPTALKAQKQAAYRMMSTYVADRPLRSELHPHGILARNNATGNLYSRLSAALSSISNRGDEADMALLEKLHASCAPPAADATDAAADIFGDDWSDAMYTTDEQQVMDARFDAEETQWRSCWTTPGTSAPASHTALAPPTTLLEQIQTFDAATGLRRSEHDVFDGPRQTSPQSAHDALRDQIQNFDKNSLRPIPDARPAGEQGMSGALQREAEKMFARHFDEGDTSLQQTQFDDNVSDWKTDA